MQGSSHSSSTSLDQQAVFLVMAGMGLMAGQEAIAKFLGQYMPVPQVVWARYAGHFILMMIVLAPRYGFQVFRSQKPLLQTGRSLLLFIDTILFFVGLTMIGLAEATAIFFMAPIIIVLISIPFLGERVGLYSFVAILIGFCGMLIIIRPGLEGFNIGGLFVLGSALCFSFFNIITRKFAGTDSSQVTMMYTAMVGFIAATVALPYFWVTPVDVLIWAGMVFIGILGGAAHCLFIVAYEKEEASKLAPFMYSQIIFAIGFGWLFFAMLPDIYTTIGSCVVIGSGLFLWKRGRVKAEDIEQA